MRACVDRGSKAGLANASAAHVLVYWPASDAPRAAYGVVLVPGTGAGNGPAYAHRPAKVIPAGLANEIARLGPSLRTDNRDERCLNSAHDPGRP